MPTTHNIPARTERHCEPCQYHKCVGSFHVRSGPGSWRDYNCMHPDAWNEDTSVPLTPEQELRAAEIRALVGKEGRNIGRTEKQPCWCPLLREPANEKGQR